MATDPFHSFEADLKVSLKAAQTLASDYDRIRRSSGGNGGKKGSSSEEEETVFQRLQDSLETLENDIGDISESVQMIEARGPERFGVDSKELLRRKTFVRECENQLQRLSKIFQSASSKNRQNYGNRQDLGEEEDDDDEDATLAFEMEQQQQLMHKQDNTLDMIGNAITSLRRQAGTLGQEIGEQVEMIGALDSEVDHSQSKLNRALGKMDELVRRSDDRMGGWCVWLLIILLMVLALIAFII